MRKMIATMAVAAAMTAALSGSALAQTTAIVEGAPAGETMKGTARADVMKGLGGGDAIHGLGGDDLLYGNAGRDALYGGSGDDTMRGGSGDDRAEERKVFGGSGDDTLHGDAGSDALYGGPGADMIFSEGDGEVDVVDCGAGTDTVKKSPREQLDRFVGCERFVA